MIEIYSWQLPSRAISNWDSNWDSQCIRLEFRINQKQLESITLKCTERPKSESSSAWWRRTRLDCELGSASSHLNLVIAIAGSEGNPIAVQLQLNCSAIASSSKPFEAIWESCIWEIFRLLFSAAAAAPGIEEPLLREAPSLACECTHIRIPFKSPLLP